MTKGGDALWYNILKEIRHLSFLGSLGNADPICILLIALIVLIIVSPYILTASGKLAIDLALSKSIRKSADRKDEQH